MIHAKRDPSFFRGKMSGVCGSEKMGAEPQIGSFVTYGDNRNVIHSPSGCFTYCPLFWKCLSCAIGMILGNQVQKRLLEL